MDITLLDKIIKDTVKHLEEGKQQISDIAESVRQERDSLYNNLLEIKKETLETIEQVDRLEQAEKSARLYLMKVSREFDRYSEEDVKNAYNNARDIQLKLGLLREREVQLRIRRDQMGVSLRRLQDTLEKAENLVSKVSIALNFLLGNLKEMGTKLEEIQQKQQLGMRIIKAQEEERRRVAREIHDGPAQSMANVVLRVEICEKLLKIKPEEVKKELSELKGLVKESLQDVRKIIFDLRPMVLDDLGLVPALKRYIAELQERCSLHIDFQVLGNTNERLSGTLEIALFRIIQEALNNVIKHAQAKTVEVYLEQAQTQVNLRIKDDGCGFDLEKVLNNSNSDSYGLIGIRERVELLEGNFKILTAPGKGTNLLVKIPFGKKNQAKSEEAAK
ncbi:MAG: histidine kinase [Firmicutes bacterium]|nr:histidine kinase [Bacillota bacterium]